MPPIIDKANISLVLAATCALGLMGGSYAAGSRITTLETKIEAQAREISDLRAEAKANSTFKDSIRDDLNTIKNQLDILTRVAAGDLIIPAKGHK